MRFIAAMRLFGGSHAMRVVAHGTAPCDRPFGDPATSSMRGTAEAARPRGPPPPAPPAAQGSGDDFDQYLEELGADAASDREGERGSKEAGGAAGGGGGGGADDDDDDDDGDLDDYLNELEAEDEEGEAGKEEAKADAA